MGEYIKLFRIPGGDMRAHFLAQAASFRAEYAKALGPDAGPAHSALLRGSDGEPFLDEDNSPLYLVRGQDNVVTSTPFDLEHGPWFTEELQALDAVVAHQSLSALIKTPALLPPLAKVFGVFVSGLIDDWPQIRLPVACPLSDAFYRSETTAMHTWLSRFSAPEAQILKEALWVPPDGRGLLPTALVEQLRAAWPVPLGADDTPFQLDQVARLDATTVQQAARWLGAQHRGGDHSMELFLRHLSEAAEAGDAILICRY